jgi:signal transduction histidine kinase
MKAPRKPIDGYSGAVLDRLIVNSQVVATERGALKAASPTLRIVLVEDNDPDSDLIQQTLADSGLNFTLATVDTREAFEAELSHKPPSIILSDYCLPQFDGSTALEIALHLAPEVPFIFVTGVLGEEVAIEMLREAELRRETQKAQEKLRRSYDQLRALTGHLRFVREEERTRIAREVHDELGQALTGIKLDLSWLSGKISGERVLQRKIKAMSAHIDATILTVRRIATELRPGVLDNLGLAAAIEWQAAEFQERTGIRCEVKIAVAETIWDREFNTMCFRIFQETLTNVIRHAKATRVDVSLTQVDHELILTVRDNGRGILEKEVIHAQSIGLIGMKERVAQAGGQVFFFGLPNRGTTVTMRVPMPEALIKDQSAS